MASMASMASAAVASVTETLENLGDVFTGNYLTLGIGHLTASDLPRFSPEMATQGKNNLTDSRDTESYRISTTAIIIVLNRFNWICHRCQNIPDKNKFYLREHQKKQPRDFYQGVPTSALHSFKSKDSSNPSQASINKSMT
jgi:NADH:ubiquinone oxidoreductase subunit